MAARRNSRIFNERRDILYSLDDNELIQRYRFDRYSIVYICDILKQELSPITQRSCAVSCVIKVLVTLRYLATGKFQMCNGDDHGLSQPTISRVIFQTLDSLTSHCFLRRFVTFPVQPQEIRRHQQRFYQTANFPGIVGVIDGTHIQIQAPSVNEKDFVNRHNYHSVNTQIVFDSGDHIIDIVARWPGSTQDSRILTTSGLCRMFEGNRLPVSCHLLEDSGYPCRRWILTPFLRPLQGPQTNYNRIRNLCPRYLTGSLLRIRVQQECNKTDSTIKSCSGKCTTVGDFVRNVSEHNHPTVNSNRVRFVSNTRKRAREETTPIQQLYNQQIAEEDDAQAQAFPAFPSMGSALYRHRRKTIPDLP
ncbi:putative nuclease HARBI1 [Haliotis cracherodii]|uniref:putative nuclease HARBI1 n=1 Tax=Haliotis cracherodii TaxID=6455 RepID=UPI0039ED1CC4